MKIQIQINRIWYIKESGKSFWCILDTDVGKCVGVISWHPQEKEMLEVSGQWGTREGEKQFEFKHALPYIPDNPKAKLHLVCEMAYGIGEANELDIWDALGDEWESIKPGMVKGIGMAKYMALRDAIEQININKEKLHAISWMLAHGLTWNMAESAFNEWKLKAVGFIQSDMYILTELPHYGFTHVDALREHFDIPDGDRRRINAAIIYSIKKLSESGSTVFSLREIECKFRELIQGHGSAMCYELARMLKYGDLKGFKITRMVALARYAEAEREVWEYAV